VNLLGVRVSAVNLGDAVARVLDAVASGVRGWICVRDAHGLVRCQNDAELRRAHNEAFLVTPDGMPLVWALRLSGRSAAGRVYGPDLMGALFEAGQARGLRHFLYGATPEVLDRLESRLLARCPQARIVGRHAPPFRPLTPDEEGVIALMIDGVGTDVVWVGLSTPKQELWMARMRDRLAAPMLIGVGAAFDFHAGLKPQAPRWLQRSGFEWLFRLCTEPRRLWRRYAETIPAFIGLAALQASGLRRFPIPERAEAPPADPARPFAGARP
jgi:N-acetylglucosaminyldiphosphoundecaprenol N-acetyl-beta-D-mannosaminyltransferase